MVLHLSCGLNWWVSEQELHFVAVSTLHQLQGLCVCTCAEGGGGGGGGGQEEGMDEANNSTRQPRPFKPHTALSLRERCDRTPADKQQ